MTDHNICDACETVAHCRRHGCIPFTTPSRETAEIAGKDADPRYPYTHAYDYLRMQTAESNEHAGFAMPKFSRGDCAAICHAIAPALGITAETLAMKIADHARATGDQQS